MRTYARIEDGHAAELFATAANIGNLFHPQLQWVDVTALAEVKVGWSHSAGKFSPPAPTPPPEPALLLNLQAQLASLTQQIAALAKAS